MTARRNEVVLAGSRDHLISLGPLYVEQRLAWLARRESLRSEATRTSQLDQVEAHNG